jgi:hypothetical protein
MSNLEPTRPQRTQPARPAAAPPPPAKRVPSKSELEQRPGCLRGMLRSPIFVLGLVVLAGLLLVSAASAAVGWSVGSAQFDATATMEAGLYMLEQYNLALTEIDQEQYGLARQRLEFIYSQDPDFLDVYDKLLNVLLVVGQTPQSTAMERLEHTPTPTLDPRPREELFNAAQTFIGSRNWTSAIDTLLALRKSDPSYRTADVDGWLYAALRNRGAQNIVELGLFEPGLYDFFVAEKFGPLDAQAATYREWARLYLYGNAFWLAYPQDAAYYYGQLVSMAPDLRDSNGVSAFGRFWQSLVHYADQLAAEGEWCDSYEAYQRAQAARADGGLQPTQQYALEQCFGPSETPSLVPSITPTFLFSPTPSATGVVPSDTATIGVPSDTPTASETPTATETPTETPSPTP